MDFEIWIIKMGKGALIFQVLSRQSVNLVLNCSKRRVELVRQLKKDWYLENEKGE